MITQTVMDSYRVVKDGCCKLYNDDNQLWPHTRHTITTSNISDMIDIVSSGYLNTEKRVENTTSSGVFFEEIRGVWIADETLSRVFDISSQSKQKLRSKGRSKIVKIYANKTGYPNLLHCCEFPCFNLMNY